MNENEPKISIIIPAYNSAETIERAVRSALDQTYGNVEVIVVDDGSSDDTPAIAGKIAEDDERVRLILKTRGGVSAARNDGIMSAQGEWFLTLDADDYFDREAVYTLYDTARRTDADLIMCGLRMVYGDGRRVTSRVREDYTDEKGDFISNIFVELYDKHLIATHSNKIYRTDLVREHEIYYNELLSVNEDIDFVLRYLKVCKNIGVVKGAYLNYVQHGTGESLITTFQPYGIAGAVLVLIDCNKLFEDIYTTNKTIRAMNERLFWHICSYVGIMYSLSGFSDERKLTELKELMEKEDFRKLMKDLNPGDIKTFTAKFLLKNRFPRAYHALCRLIYREKHKTLPPVPAHDDAYVNDFAAEDAVPAGAEETSEAGVVPAEYIKEAKEGTAGESPVEDIPAEEAPAEEMPAEETPAEETPAGETPAEEAPAEEAPAGATPAEEAPAEEVPAEDAPSESGGVAEETPEGEPRTEEPPAEHGEIIDASAENIPAEIIPGADILIELSRLPYRELGIYTNFSDKESVEGYAEEEALERDFPVDAGRTAVTGGEYIPDGETSGQRAESFGETDGEDTDGTGEITDGTGETPDGTGETPDGTGTTCGFNDRAGSEAGGDTSEEYHVDIGCISVPDTEDYSPDLDLDVIRQVMEETAGAISQEQGQND